MLPDQYLYLAQAKQGDWQREFDLRAARGEFIPHAVPAHEGRNWFSAGLRGVAEILQGRSRRWTQGTVTRIG